MLGKLFGRKADPATVTVNPGGVVVDAADGITVLNAALNGGLAYPHNCRVGSCGECRSTLISGKIKALTDFSYTLSAADIDAGCILACQSIPRGPVAVSPVLGLRDKAVTVAARIVEQAALTHDILRVVLETDSPLAYVAGQYAAWTVAGVASGRAYSFAAAPVAGGCRLSFTIRHVPGGALTDWLFAADRRGETVTLDLPQGSFGLRADAGHALFIAGGSGLGPVLSVLEAMAAAGDRRKVTVLFGARTTRDLYLLDHLAGLGRVLDLTVRPVLSAESPDSDWPGERGMVTDALRDLALPSCAALCGPPAMIDAAVAILTARGLPAPAISFDKFTDASDGQARPAA